MNRITGFGRTDSLQHEASFLYSIEFAIASMCNKTGGQRRPIMLYGHRRYLFDKISEHRRNKVFDIVRLKLLSGR